MKYLGMLDSYQGLILPGIFDAFGTFLLRQFLFSIPKSLEDAAFIDGASHFKVYWRIVLPLSKPALATLFIFAFMKSWNDYLWPLIVITRQELMPLPLGLSVLMGRFFTDWNLILAGVFMTILPVIAVYIIMQRYIIEGISLTGLKELTSGYFLKEVI